MLYLKKYYSINLCRLSQIIREVSSITFEASIRPSTNPNKLQNIILPSMPYVLFYIHIFFILKPLHIFYALDFPIVVAYIDDFDSRKVKCLLNLKGTIKVLNYPI